ncbi:hypothetical protein GCM10027614_44440 [Micromonospora vulcania]
MDRSGCRADPGDPRGWPGTPSPFEPVEELPASVAEPVSGPPAPRRGFTPIVIEGTIIESRDLTDPAEAGGPVDAAWRPGPEPTAPPSFGSARSDPAPSSSPMFGSTSFNPAPSGPSPFEAAPSDPVRSGSSSFEAAPSDPMPSGPNPFEPASPRPNPFEPAPPRPNPSSRHRLVRIRSSRCRPVRSAAIWRVATEVAYAPATSSVEIAPAPAWARRSA